MDEIKNQLPDITVRSLNFKTNINLNSKTQAVQNVNFQEILNSAGGQQSSQSLSSQSSINLDSLTSLSQNNEGTGTSNEKVPLNDKNTTSALKASSEQETHTSLFSQFIPQKPLNIADKTFKFSTSVPNEEKEPDDHSFKAEKKADKKTAGQKPENLKTKPAKEPEHKKENRSFYNSDTYKDSYTKEITKNETYNDNLKIFKKDILINPLILPGNEQNPDEDQKRRKPGTWEIPTENNVESSDTEFLAEVGKIIEGYGFEEPAFNLSRADSPNSTDYNLWLKSLIFGASKEPLTVKDSDLLSKYIVKDDKIPFTDKEILAKLLSDIFKHQVISLNPNLISRLEKTGIELIYRAFPTVILNGFLKKTVTEAERGKKTVTFAVYKLVNGILMTPDELDELSSLFNNEFETAEVNTLKKLFTGNFHKEDIEQIKFLIARIAEQDLLPPGFTGFLYELFMEQVYNEHQESARQVLQIIEVYASGRDFSFNEAKITAGLITKKYFTSKLMNKNKVTEILTRLITGEKVDFLSLELLAKISGQSLLSYLPARLDPDVKYFLKYLPFTENEVVSAENILEGGNKFPEFQFCGKINISKKSIIAGKVRLLLTLYNKFSEKETEVETDKNFVFNKLIETGDYQLTNLKIIMENGLPLKEINIPLNRSLNNDVSGKNIILFNVEAKIDIFYFGTLKVFLEPGNFTLQKLSLKNDYKSFQEYYKKVLKKELKEKKIKINSKLYNK
jgi:hypothetical protein